MSKKALWSDHTEMQRLTENFRRFLNEHTIPNKAADINDMDAQAVWDIMTGDDPEEATRLLQAIGSATGWGSGALKKGGITDLESLKKRAAEIWGDPQTFLERVGAIVTKLGAAQGFSKPEMPAFEGGDIDMVANALSEPGEINVDFGADYAGGTPDFDKYFTQKQAKKKGMNEIKNDPRFPFPGKHQVMPGAPNLGAKGSIDLGKIGGKAGAFLTKGKDNQGDNLKVNPNQSLKNGAMQPTQKNVKAAKSLLFALLDIGEDMGGAFATPANEIIDGHHRWSDQFLRTGGDMTHTGVHIVDPGELDIQSFLTMLTTMGTALGRPTKK